MNYRERQIRQTYQSQFIPKQDYQSLELNNALLEGDLEALRTSLDFTNLAHWERENQQLKAELAQTEAFNQAQDNFLKDLETQVSQRNSQLQSLTQELASKTAILAQQKQLLTQFLNQKQAQLSHA